MNSNQRKHFAAVEVTFKTAIDDDEFEIASVDDFNDAYLVLDIIVKTGYPALFPVSSISIIDNECHAYIKIDTPEIDK